MKNKLLTAMIGMIFLVTLLILNLNIASAEINLWTDTYLNQNASTVTMYALVNLYDTSTDLITISKPIPVVVRYNTQLLPYNISQYYSQYPNAIVDWCNLTMKHEENIFDGSTGRIVNYTTITDNFYLTNASLGTIGYRLHHEDVLSIAMTCHYTNPDTLFIDSLYFGQFSTFFPAHECLGCDKYSFEELTQENENFQDRVEEEMNIYTAIQNIIEKNYMLWVIMKWVLRIALIIGAVGLIFAGMYFFYVYIKNLAGMK
jgi:hypothetical protein